MEYSTAAAKTIDLLTARDTLYPDRLPIVLMVEPPASDCGSVTQHLVAALLDRYEQAGQAAEPFTRRLQYAAAAGTLRRATAQLP